jgi:hypothetical protein
LIYQKLNELLVCSLGFSIELADGKRIDFENVSFKNVAYIFRVLELVSKGKIYEKKHPLQTQNHIGFAIVGACC